MQRRTHWQATTRASLQLPKTRRIIQRASKTILALLCLAKLKAPPILMFQNVPDLLWLCIFTSKKFTDPQKRIILINWVEKGKLPSQHYFYDSKVHDVSGEFLF